MVEFLTVFLVGVAFGAVGMFLIARSGGPAVIESKLFSLKLPGNATGEVADNAQIEAAFERFTDVAQAVVAIADATDDVASTAREWFDYLASNLSGALRANPGELYRVAIWEDVGDPDAFVGIGWAMFDANDPAMERLSKKDSLAGMAFRSPTREYYCPDVTKDPNYRPHSERPKRYRSVLAIALGAPQPWGVMTIDAKSVDGFSESDLIVARRFATLISVGYALEAASETEPE